MAPTEATAAGSATVELKFFMALAGRVGANIGFGTTAEVHATATADESCVDATISAFAAGSVELDYCISSWEPIRLTHTFASTPAHHWCIPRSAGPAPDPGLDPAPGSDPSPPPVVAPPARARRSLLIPVSSVAGHVDLA